MHLLHFTRNTIRSSDQFGEGRKLRVSALPPATVKRGIVVFYVHVFCLFTPLHNIRARNCAQLFGEHARGALDARVVHPKIIAFGVVSVASGREEKTHTSTFHTATRAYNRDDGFMPSIRCVECPLLQSFVILSHCAL